MSFFSSSNIWVHLARGAAGAGAVWAAVHYGAEHPLAAAGLIAAALVCFRGCPVCWTAGLIETISRRG